MPDGSSKVIACSREAQALVDIHNQCSAQFAETLSKQAAVEVCSPNYELYADVHTRLIKSLGLLAPSVKANAYNEALLNLHGVKINGSFRAYATNIKQTLMQWLGISVFVGVGPTSVLAKLACGAAHNFGEFDGIISLCDSALRQQILNRVIVSEVSGISEKAAAKLSAINIHTALELSIAPKAQIRRHCSVVIERIALELSGLECLEPGFDIDNRVINTGIDESMTTQTYSSIKRELYIQVVNAQNRLESIENACKTVTISLTIAPLVDKGPLLKNSLSADFSKPVDSISAINQLAAQLLESLWQTEHRYHLLGVCLGDLSSVNARQYGFFGKPLKAENKTLEVQRRPRICFETVLTAEVIQGPKNNDVWHPPKSRLSPRFTTRWGDLPRAS
jgi:DNA polymerase V